MSMKGRGYAGVTKIPQVSERVPFLFTLYVHHGSVEGSRDNGGAIIWNVEEVKVAGAGGSLTPTPVKKSGTSLLFAVHWLELVT